MNKVVNFIKYTFTTKILQILIKNFVVLEFVRINKQINKLTKKKKKRMNRQTKQ